MSAERQLETLRQMVIELAQAGDIRSVLQVIARSTMTALGYEDCVIYLVESRPERVLVQRAAHGPKSPNGLTVVDPIELDFGAGIVGTCAANALPLRVDDTSIDPRYVVDDAARGSELAVPIIDNGEVIGVIDSEHSLKAFYTPLDEQAVNDIASLAAARLRTAMTIEQLERNVDELEQTRAELDDLARTDGLTGLLNRRGFEEAVGRFGKRKKLVGAILDIDRFKILNDTHGHPCGDTILRKLAQIVSAESMSRNLTASRLGGDEFMVIGEHVDDVHDAMLAILQKVRSERWVYGLTVLDVTVSIGMAESARDQTWALADEALYLAKAEGRDQLIVYADDDPRVQANRLDRYWADEVHRAISSDAFLLFAQPIIDLAKVGEPSPAYYEVLLRRRMPNGQPASPSRLLGAAERFGLSERLDTWVLQSTLSWLVNQESKPNIAINVGAPFVGSVRALANLEKMMVRTGADPSQLCFEITETMGIEDLDRTVSFVRTIQRWGCKVAIDDFGSGWTSLPLVQDLGVDILKIDGSWIKKASTDLLACSVVNSTVEAARILGVDVVAEWVEDRQTLDFVTSLGIRYVQGFLFGMPHPLHEITASNVEPYTTG